MKNNKETTFMDRFIGFGKSLLNRAGSVNEQKKEAKPVENKGNQSPKNSLMRSSPTLEGVRGNLTLSMRGSPFNTRRGSPTIVTRNSPRIGIKAARASEISKAVMDMAKDDNLPSILSNAIDHAHSIIRESASLITTPPEDIAFNDIEIQNMRAIICDKAKQINPTLYSNNISDELGFSDPQVLEISKRCINETRIGNCGEFVVLALTYLLDNHKDTLKKYDVSVMKSGDHVYLYLQKKGNNNNEGIIFDPTTKEAFSSSEALGNIYIRGRRGRPNKYMKFTSEDKFVEVVKLNIATLAYPPSIDASPIADESNSNTNMSPHF